MSTLHALHAVTTDHTKLTIDTNLAWGDAQDKWLALDNERFKSRKTILADGMTVAYLAVRSVNDPDWTEAKPVTSIEVITPKPRTRKDDSKKLTKVEAGWYATVDGTWAVMNDGIGYVPVAAREGTGVDAGVTGDEWVVCHDPKGRLRHSRDAGDNIGWFTTKREAVECIKGQM